MLLSSKRCLSWFMYHVSGFNLLLSCKRVSFWCYYLYCLLFVGFASDDTVDRKGVAARAGGEANVGRGCSLWIWQAKLSPLC